MGGVGEEGAVGLEPVQGTQVGVQYDRGRVGGWGVQTE